MNILAAPPTAARQEIAGRSLWQDALARLARNRAAVVSVAVLAVIALMAVLAPWISPHPFDDVFWDDIRTPPDFAKAHWFGTDVNGRDLFARVGRRRARAFGNLARMSRAISGICPTSAAARSPASPCR